VTAGGTARRGVLDPLGADLAAGPDAYFQLLRGLSAGRVWGRIERLSAATVHRSPEISSGMVYGVMRTVGASGKPEHSRLYLIEGIYFTNSL